jgi:hypothetical protein
MDTTYAGLSHGRLVAVAESHTAECHPPRARVADSRRLTFRDQRRLLNRIGERQFTAVDELKNECSGVELRQAADAEAVIRSDRTRVVQALRTPFQRARARDHVRSREELPENRFAAGHRRSLATHDDGHGVASRPWLEPARPPALVRKLAGLATRGGPVVRKLAGRATRSGPVVRKLASRAGLAAGRPPNFRTFARLSAPRLIE